VTTATASNPGLDEATAAAIRQAITAARLGRLDDACATAEQALAAGGDPVALNAMLGMLRTQAGETKAAIRHLRVAHEARPADVRIAANLTSALVADNEYAEAFAVVSPALAFSDPTLQLARFRGFLAQTLDRPEAAVEAYEHVVAAKPNDWESWNNLGNARNVLDDFEGSIAALERAQALNSDAAPTRINLARAYRLTGQMEKAEAQLRAMADDFPEDAKPLIDLHDLLKEQGRSDEEVLEVLERAIAREPDNVELLTARARHLALMLEMDRAEAAFRSVLARDPANTDAFVGLALVYEHSRAAALPDLVAEAERSDIEASTLNLVRAFGHRRARRYAEGLAALQDVPEDFESAEHLLGQMLEGLGDHDAAFAAFARMNARQAEDPSQPLLRAKTLRDQLRKQLEQTSAEWIRSWKAPAVKSPRPAPVFLVGFPRSGTTLLDTMLMGHPDVDVMEERPVLNNLGTALGGFEKLADLDEGQVREAQGQYFEAAARHVELRDGALLVDKSPLHLNNVPFIHRLFPDARFILALRHPADSVLSCYASNFRLNSSMANFLRLDTAAEFYDLTFRTWENARALLPIEVHTIAYEQLVDDPEAELRRLSEALGLSWRDEMLDHRKTAAARGVITTASYAQVTEPIYQRSVGRWERYRKHLEPILPVLAPWAEKFGYKI